MSSSSYYYDFYNDNITTLIICCRKVVFPAPRNPEMIVTGMGNFPFFSLLVFISFERGEDEEDDDIIANDCKTLEIRLLLPARTVGTIIDVTN